MTWTRDATVAGIVSILLVASIAIVGNQRQVYAQSLAQDLICEIYQQLQEAGQPIPPDLDAGNCDGYVPPEVPSDFPQCADGIDNDGDGLQDYLPGNELGDPECEGSFDDDESPQNCGEGMHWDAEAGQCVADPEPTPAELCEADGGTWNAEYDEGAGRCEFALTVTDVGPGATMFGENPAAGTSMHATGSLVTLTPVPATNAVFQGFSGDCAGTSACELVMDAAKTVTATFACAEGYELSEAECVPVEDDQEEPNDGNTGGGGGYAQASYGGGGGNGPIVGSLGGGGAVLGVTTIAPTAPTAPVATSAPMAPEAPRGEACDTYITAFLKFGGGNDPEQVKRLQHVLKTFEGANVEETGVFDEATLAAVHAFQTKYAEEILAPWGISESTGFVYLTTRKKLNEIYCQPTGTFPLTEEERAIIEASRTPKAQTAGAAAAMPEAMDEGESEPTDIEEDTDETLSEDENESPVTSPWDSVSNFLQRLFGR